MNGKEIPTMNTEEKIIRFARYLGFSSEMQQGNTSIAVQNRATQDYIDRQNGRNGTVAILDETYIDQAQSGRTLKRTEFDRMLRDAEKGKFDALVVYDWGRLSRDLVDSKAVKAHLRYDLSIAVYSVLEPGEDDAGIDGSTSKP